MLTRCGMLLHSFPMQRRLTWSHPPKAAAFFFHSPFLALPCQNYTNPCQLIMEDGGSTNIHVWLGSCNLANSGDDDQHGKSCTCRLFHGKKNFFYTICKAYLCVEKQRRVWHERKTAMQACRAQQLTLLTCWPVTISAGSSLIRSGYAARWSGRLLSGGLWQLDGQSFSCTATAWKPRRLGPVELAMNKCS